jgi:DNA-binding transcriptional regulator YiaG
MFRKGKTRQNLHKVIETPRNLDKQNLEQRTIKQIRNRDNLKKKTLAI